MTEQDSELNELRRDRARTLEVLFVLPGLGGGGAEMNAARLSNPLKIFGINCSYACFSSVDDYSSNLAKDTVVHYINCKPTRSSTLRALQSVRPLSRLIRSHDFDVVIAVTGGPFMTLALLRLLGFTQQSVVLFSVQNAQFKALKETKGVGAWLHYQFLRFVHAQADGAIALTAGVANDLVQAVPRLHHKVRMVHNVGTEDPRTLNPVISENWTGPFRLVACGRLVKVKGYGDLLRAVAMTSTHHQVHLDIIGSGPLQSELTKLAEQLGIGASVVFHGFVASPEKIMKKADLFVLSSYSEGFGNVIVEAMALGIPVLSTDCPYGPREIIQNNENGILVPVGDPSALSMAMKRLLDDSKLRKRLALAGFQRSQDFTPEQIGAQFAKATKELVFEINGNEFSE